MSKEHEGYLDTILYRACEYVSDIFYDTGHTPNGITTYSLIAGLLAISALKGGHPLLFAGLWSVGYFFDCLDGYIARKYGMVSALGDVYDHAKDLIVFGLLVWTVRGMHASNRIAMDWQSGVALAIASAGMLVQLGCQQKLSNTRSVLDALQPLCMDTSLLQYTRWFSSATLHIVIVYVVLRGFRATKF